MTGKRNLDDSLAAYEAGAQSVRAMRPAGKAAAFTAAAGAALALAPSADAALQYSGVLGYPVHVGAPGSYSFDLNQDSAMDFAFALGVGSSVRLGPQLGNAAIHTSLGRLARLSAGAVVSSLQPLGTSNRALRQGYVTSSGFLTTAGVWPGGTMSTPNAGFLGVRFNIGGDTHYGWIRVGIDNDIMGAPTGYTIYDWAWEDTPNAAVIVGAIPEPGPAAGLALLAAGAAGVAAWRRRKKAEPENS